MNCDFGIYESNLTWQTWFDKHVSQNINHFFMVTVCSDWTFIGARMTGHDKKLKHTTSWKQSRTLFWWFGPNPFFRASSTSPSHNLLNFKNLLPPLPNSLSAAQGISQRESQGHPWLRQLTPTAVETQQASWRQTQSHWATTVSSWTPTLPSQALGKILRENVLTKANKKKKKLFKCVWWKAP